MKKATCLMALLLCGWAAHAALPDGWQLAGNKPQSYDCGVDQHTVYNGKPSGYLKSKSTAIDGFGTMMQYVSAEDYAGRRVRFSAYVMSENAADWAGLWMRVDKDRQMVGFDNMQNRAVKGSTFWKYYEVVLDVPEGSTGIGLGILLAGTGTVWLNSAKFEVVGTNIPTTSTVASQTSPAAGPTNLGFEK